MSMSTSLGRTSRRSIEVFDNTPELSVALMANTVDGISFFVRGKGDVAE